MSNSARAENGETPPDLSNQVSARQWLAVVGAVIGAFMAVLDIQITNASLKDITGALGATLDEGSWISTSYLTTEIVIIPLSGWLSSIFPRESICSSPRRSSSFSRFYADSRGTSRA